MITSIIYQGLEISVYGWKLPAFAFFGGNPKFGKSGSVQLMTGEVSFSCPITLPVGACFSLKGSTDSFVVTSAKINQHQARVS